MSTGMAKKKDTSFLIPPLSLSEEERRKIEETTYISQAEAGRRLRLSRATINYLINKGRLRSVEFLGRRAVVYADVLDYQPTRPGPKSGKAGNPVLSTTERKKSAKKAKPKKK
jgi:predicted DNA-binding protein (UPF0251 family)